MLRLLMIVSGAIEALFGVAAILVTSTVIDALGTGGDPAAIFFARALGAATLGIGIAALLARNELQTHGASFGPRQNWVVHRFGRRGSSMR